MYFEYKSKHISREISPRVSSVTEITLQGSVRLRLMPLVSGVFGLTPPWAHGGPQIWQPLGIRPVSSRVQTLGTFFVLTESGPFQFWGTALRVSKRL